MTWEVFGRSVFAAIIKYVNIQAAYTYVGSVHARSLIARTYVQSRTCLPDGFA